MTRKALLSILLILGTLAACSPMAEPASFNSNLSAWIDAPLDETILPLAPYEIVAHASDPTEVTVLEIFINDVFLAAFDNPSPEDLLLTIHHEWEPTKPGEYVIKARSQNRTGLWSDFAEVHVVVKEDFSPIGLELVPTETLAIEIINCDPSLTANTNTTCRQGPSSYHPPAAYLLEGESAVIVGRNQDSSWWLTDLQDIADPCWIADSTVKTACQPDDLALKDSPPYITRIIKSNLEFYWGDHHQKTITFQAQAAGESPVVSVLVIYQVTGSNNWNSVALSNTSGDIWEGTIHAHSIKDYKSISASFLQYYLQATSENGLTMQSEVFNDVKIKEVP